jgi:endo-1,4-beta-xylanase
MAFSIGSPAFKEGETIPAQFTCDGDDTPPSIHVSLSPDVLWPANHELAPITATISASDDSGEAPEITLVSIVSNEPDNGRADGNTKGDIREAQLGTDDRSFLLRAERAGNGDGRVYTVTYRARDASGNESTARAQVHVPLRPPKTPHKKK